MQHERYGIVLIPEERISRLAIGISNQLVGYGSLFVLEDGKIYPHISLYHFDAQQLGKEDAALILSGLEAGMELTARKFVSCEAGPSEGYVDVEYEKSTALESLQLRAIEAARPIQAPQSRPYDAIGESFRPHLTLGRFERYNEMVVRSLGDAKPFTGQFPSVGLFEMGRSGTCVRKIGENTF